MVVGGVLGEGDFDFGVGDVVGDEFADFLEGVGGGEFGGGVAYDELVLFRYDVVDVDKSL